jgi:hypothetical protein
MGFTHLLHASQVPGALTLIPAASFGSVCVLNLLNFLSPASLAHETRFKSNLALLLVVCLAFTTDLCIFLHLTPLALAGSGRL